MNGRRQGSRSTSPGLGRGDQGDRLYRHRAAGAEREHQVLGAGLGVRVRQAQAERSVDRTLAPTLALPEALLTESDRAAAAADDTHLELPWPRALRTRNASASPAAFSSSRSASTRAPPSRRRLVIVSSAPVGRRPP